ncbi:MAG: protein adenylyltransferase SelO family protein, partial [Thiovulaceae bacterium]|nr:protein adenylyltransferase SelO family protein [Sulfurimonadaceae bacterium]
SHPKELAKLDEIRRIFPQAMNVAMEKMWASKLGMTTFDVELFQEFASLMMQTSVDYTILFRELSHIPEDISPLINSFYNDAYENEQLLKSWSTWLEKWKSHIDASSSVSRERLSQQMKQINPKYTLREWLLVPAYKQAQEGDYTLLKELQEVMTNPYTEQSKEIEEKYYREKPSHLFDIAGVSHITCSS